MHVDVPTLYYMAVATTLVASGLTLREKHFNPRHTSELGLWAAGYLLIAFGCGIRIVGGQLPSFLSLGVSNACVAWGYAIVALGIARFVKLTVPRWAFLALGAVTIAWLSGGYLFDMASRVVLTSAANAVPCGLAAWALLRRSGSARRLPSQTFAGAIFALHGAFFAFRALLTAIDPGQGVSLTGMNITVTMIEGLLWSVAAPITLLALAREKTEHGLLVVSNTDYLTGLDNRRAFFEKGERLMERAGGVGEPIVLLAFDLDHFKTINDRFGHAAGDAVLQLFAAAAQSVLTPKDVLARLGGEEFVALVRVSSVAAAQDIASRIAAEFSASTRAAEWLGLPVTASIGLAEAPRDGETLGALLSAADLALYRAKALGRNRIERAGDTVTISAAA